MTNTQHRFDTTTLTKALIGFDRIITDTERLFANSVQTNYPPYNLLKTDDSNYVVEVAVTGFTKDQVTVDVDQQQLIITASSTSDEDTDIEYLYRGLASRNFTRKFNLADYMVIDKAELANGLLRVYIKRVLPDALRPRRIEVLG